NTHNHTNTHCSGFGCYFLLRAVAGASFCGHEARGGERESTASHSSSCRRDATTYDRFEPGIKFHCGWNYWKCCGRVMDGCGIAFACGSLGDCSVCVVLAAGLWPYPVGRGVELEAVAVCRFSSCIVCDCWRCVRLLCGGPNPLTRGLAALRWCVFVRAGVELPARARTVAVLFPKFVSSVCVVLLLAFPLVILSSCVSAWSGRMLTGHVDCECLLTASIHLPLSLPLPVCHSLLCVWRVALREGWPAHTDGPP
ncbi:trans-sialidase, partial [Trypanosoma cruzi]